MLTARVMEAVKSAMLVDVVEDLRKLMLGGRELEVAKFIEARPHVVSVQVAGDGVLVGCCDGIMSDGEIEAFEEYGRAISRTLSTVDKRELEPFRLRGRKFVSEEQFGDRRAACSRWRTTSSSSTTGRGTCSSSPTGSRGWTWARGGLC